MQPQRKCCAHCPGSVTQLEDENREHECCLPTYVNGNLRISSLKSQNNNSAYAKMMDKHKERKIYLNKNEELIKEANNISCLDRFAKAKKLHTENLQHQPLPDKADDAIFTSCGQANNPDYADIVKRCQRIVPRRKYCTVRSKERNGKKYVPELGCRKPLTYMDLAICWETPIDPKYEPDRPIHIDGSDGGPAPAVFNLVQHSECTHRDVKDGSIPGQPNRDEPCRHCQKEASDLIDRDDLCRNFDTIHITPKDVPDSIAMGAQAAKRKRMNFLKHCPTFGYTTGANHLKISNGNGANQANRKLSPRIIKSATNLHKCNHLRRNGIHQGKTHISRPKTPYARRSFCIDTLTPPFSIVNGFRDTDYPEHYRLTSIYQQSYRHPRKLRDGKTLLTYERLANNFNSH